MARMHAREGRAALPVRRISAPTGDTVFLPRGSPYPHGETFHDFSLRSGMRAMTPRANRPAEFSGRGLPLPDQCFPVLNPVPARAIFRAGAAMITDPISNDIPAIPPPAAAIQ